jgi:cbb3-type cytochrome oxidase maturation protein
MRELVALVAVEFAVSVFMGLAALCLFLWAAMSGLLTDVEAVKHQVLRSEEIDDDGSG